MVSNFDWITLWLTFVWTFCVVACFHFSWVYHLGMELQGQMATLRFKLFEELTSLSKVSALCYIATWCMREHIISECWSWSSNTLVTWCEELTHLKRPWCWERLRAGGGDDRGWDETVGWHHRHNGLGFGWTPRVGDGPGGLACCGSWGRNELDMTERLIWTEISFTLLVNSRNFICEEFKSVDSLSFHGARASIIP